MANIVAWFLCPYKRKNVSDPNAYYRYCAMNDFTAQIFADTGNWSESEVLGNHAIVKVSASASTIATINAATGFIKLPMAKLLDSLASLTPIQKAAITAKLLALGYTQAEVTNLGDLATLTFRDLLVFIANRRVLPEYNKATNTLTFTGDTVSCKHPDILDSEV